MKELYSIRVSHQSLGEIVIHANISRVEAERVGAIEYDFSKRKFYYGRIEDVGDGSYRISDLHVIRPERFNTGCNRGSVGGKNYVTIGCDRLIDGEFIFYPSSILNVDYTFNLKTFSVDLDNK
jgi:hypothetical protein